MDLLTLSSPDGIPSRPQAHGRSRECTFPGEAIAYWHPQWRRDASPPLDELGASVDHVRAFARGGSHDVSNFVTICARCNARKGVRSREEHLAADKPWVVKGKPAVLGATRLIGRSKPPRVHPLSVAIRTDVKRSPEAPAVLAFLGIGEPETSSSWSFQCRRTLTSRTFFFGMTVAHLQDGGIRRLRCSLRLSFNLPCYIPSLCRSTAYHVILSAFHSVSETIAHAALFAVVAYVLLRPKASAYFRVAGRHPEQPAA
jgi:hypothetical protein